MYKIFEFQCVDCKQIMEELIDTNEMDETFCPECITCKSKTERIISPTRFKLLYNPKTDSVGWAHDGYATSAYWGEVNAARDRGEDVAGAGSSVYNGNTDPTDFKNK